MAFISSLTRLHKFWLRVDNSWLSWLRVDSSWLKNVVKKKITLDRCLKEYVNEKGCSLLKTPYLNSKTGYFTTPFTPALRILHNYYIIIIQQYIIVKMCVSFYIKA